MGTLAFLPDQPIKSITEDQFGHATFVNKLIWLIESTQEHFNIGLFGKWGTGKTGILNMMETELHQQSYNKKYDYICVDAWKLSKDSLRQQLLYQLSRTYDPSTSEEEIADRLFHTKVEPISIKKETWKDTFVRLIELSIPYLILANLFIFIGIGADYFFPNRNFIPIFSSLFIIPLVLTLAKKLAEASKALSKSGKRIIPRIESPCEFADLFAELIGKRNKGTRTVIAIDNLDRCQTDLVVEMLSTIKTFMETKGVVFIVACDDNALVQHLTTIKGFEEEDAREFLRKFFQVSINIPPFVEGSLIKYVDNLSDKLAVPISETVKEVLIAATIDNPRRIKQFLNNYALNYQLSIEREAKGLVGKGILTNRQDILAKIIVIRDRFPKFYDMIKEREDILVKIESYFKGEKLEDLLDQKIEEIFAKSPGLRWFLQRTRPIEIRDVAPFIRLAQETYESLLPEQEELKIRVMNNDYNYVRRLLEKRNENEKLYIIKVILKVLKEDMQKRRFVWAFNELNVILETVELVPKNILKVLIASFESYCSSLEMLAQLSRFNKQKMFHLIRMMKEPFKNRVIVEYCGLIAKNDEIDNELLELIISNRDLMLPRTKERLNEEIVVFYEKNEKQGSEILRTIIDQKEIAKDLLTSKIFMAIINGFNTKDPIEKNTKRVELYINAKDLASNSVKHEFIKRLLNLLPETPPNAPDAKMQFVLSQLTNLEDEDIPSSVVGHLYYIIIKYVNALSNENHKITYLKLFSKVIHKMSEDKRTELLEQYIKPRFQSGQPAIVKDILGDFDKAPFNLFRHEGLFEILAERSKTNIIDVELMNFLLEKSPESKKSEASEFLMTNISSGNANRYNAALSSFLTSIQYLHKKEVDKVCSSIIKTSRNVDPNTKPKFYQALVEAYLHCSRDTQDSITYEILELMKQSEPLQSQGIEYYNKLKTQIRGEMRLLVLRQLILSLSGTLNNKMRPSLNLILENQNILEEEDHIRLIDYLRGHISPAQNEQSQILAMEYILKMPNLYRRGREVLEATLLVSKSGSQVVKDLGKKVHQTFSRYKMSNDHWKEAKEVFGENLVK